MGKYYTAQGCNHAGLTWLSTPNSLRMASDAYCSLVRIRMSLPMLASTNSGSDSSLAVRGRRGKTRDKLGAGRNEPMPRSVLEGHVELLCVTKDGVA